MKAHLSFILLLVAAVLLLGPLRKNDSPTIDLVDASLGTSTENSFDPETTSSQADLSSHSTQEEILHAQVRFLQDQLQKHEQQRQEPQRSSWTPAILQHLNRRRVASTGDEPADDHATDDHATDDHSSSAPNLFGALVTIDPIIGTEMILVIVCGVLFIEFIFSSINKLTYGTPFYEMVRGIQNELMVVGTVAFVFKIIVSTSNFLSHDYFFALEFADLLVPLFSFSNCLIGLALVFYSRHVIDMWSKAYHLRLDEILLEFYDTAKFYDNMPFLKYFWAYPHRIVAELEFRIFHSIFCETFRIHRDAFAFDEYVEKVLEKSVNDLIEIKLQHWFLFCALILFNLVREHPRFTFDDCEDDDLDCKNDNAIWMFNIFGGFVWFFTMVVALVSRYYVIKIFRQRGVTDWTDYPGYLKETEERDAHPQHRRLDETSLKRTLNEMKSHQMREDSRKSSVFQAIAYSPSMLVSHVSNRLSLSGGSASDKDRNKIAEKEEKNKTRGDSSAGFRSLAAVSNDSQASTSSAGGALPIHRYSPAPTAAATREVGVGARERVQGEDEQEMVEMNAQVQENPGPGPEPQSVQPLQTAQIAQTDRKGAGISSARASQHQHQPHPLAQLSPIPSTSSHAHAHTHPHHSASPWYGLVGAAGMHCDSASSLESGSAQVGIGIGIGPGGGGGGGEGGEMPAETAAEAGGGERGAGAEELDLRCIEDRESPLLASPQGSAPTQLLSFNQPFAKARQTEGLGNVAEKSAKPTSSLLTNKSLAKIYCSTEEGEEGAVDLEGRGSRDREMEEEEKERDEGGGQREGGARSRRGSGRSLLVNDKTTTPVSARSVPSSSLKQGIKSLGSSLSRAVSMRSSNPEANASFVDKKAEHMKQVFLFARPWLYFECVDVIIVVISIYLAFWFVNFSTSVESGTYTFLSIVPGILSIINYAYIVKICALLKAIYHVDQEVVLEVIEEAEGARLLGNALREQVLSKLQGRDGQQPMQELKAIFMSIDANGNGFLSRLEFVVFMDSMDIHFSQKKWKKIFMQVDRNFDNEISFEEFFLFLYPEHDLAKALERRRLKKLKNRVRLKSEESEKARAQSGSRRRSIALKPINAGSAEEVIHEDGAELDESNASCLDNKGRERDSERGGDGDGGKERDSKARIIGSAGWRGMEGAGSSTDSASVSAALLDNV